MPLISLHFSAIVFIVIVEVKLASKYDIQLHENLEVWKGPSEEAWFWLQWAKDVVSESIQEKVSGVNQLRCFLAHPLKHSCGFSQLLFCHLLRRNWFWLECWNSIQVPTTACFVLQQCLLITFSDQTEKFWIQEIPHSWNYFADMFVSLNPDTPAEVGIKLDEFWPKDKNHTPFSPVM